MSVQRDGHGIRVYELGSATYAEWVVANPDPERATAIMRSTIGYAFNLEVIGLIAGDEVQSLGLAPDGAAPRRLE